MNRVHSCIASRELGDSSRVDARQASARRHGHVYLALAPTSPWAAHGDSGDVSTARGLRQRLAANLGIGWHNKPPMHAHMFLTLPCIMLATRSLDFLLPLLALPAVATPPCTHFFCRYLLARVCLPCIIY